MGEKNQKPLANQTGRGGRREGSGRKPGAATIKTRSIADRAIDEGITPLEYMLKVLRDDIPQGLEPADILRAQAMKMEAAKSAAPYIHPRLNAIEHTGKNGGPIEAAVTLEVVGVSPPKPE